jgi:hypothetical protein
MGGRQKLEDSPETKHHDNNDATLNSCRRRIETKTADKMVKYLRAIEVVYRRRSGTKATNCAFIDQFRTIERI